MSDNEQIVGDESSESNDENESIDENESNEKDDAGSEESISPDNKLDVLINTSYGGYQPSKQALELYKVYTGNDYKTYNRTDLDMVRIYKELGKEEFDSSVSSTEIETIHKKYEEFYELDEYDGKETLKINYDEYKLHKLRDALKRLALSNEPITGDQLIHLAESEF